MKCYLAYTYLCIIPQGLKLGLYCGIPTRNRKYFTSLFIVMEIRHSAGFVHTLFRLNCVDELTFRHLEDCDSTSMR